MAFMSVMSSLFSCFPSAIVGLFSSVLGLWLFIVILKLIKGA